MQQRYLFFVFVVLSVFSLQPAVAQWSTNPEVNNAICTATGDQTVPTSVSDGAGGSIITWQDFRFGYNCIWAQRISATGVVQWVANGVPVCEQLSTAPQIASDGAGGAIITWTDGRGATPHIYAQRINASGVTQWLPDYTNGAPVCTATGGIGQSNTAIASDGLGGAIITWQDQRNGTYNQIFAQRFNASGTPQWAANGVLICGATSEQESPVIASAGNGGALIAWIDFRSDVHGDIYAVQVDPDGTPEYPNGFSVCTATGYQNQLSIVSSGGGGAIITWNDGRSNFHIYAQLIDWNGTYWANNGVPICMAAGPGGFPQTNPVIASDGAGGAIIAWQDYRSSSIVGTIYAQRVNASGIVQWITDGVAISVSPFPHVSPEIVSDGTGGTIITWTDSRGIGEYPDIYAQRINASGTVEWAANGVAICRSTNYQFSPTIVDDGSGGAIITWQDYRSGSNYDIYAQRIDQLGNLYPAPWIDNVVDIANDQGGKLRILWKPSALDVWKNSNVKWYTVLMGTKNTLISGKAAPTINGGILGKAAESVSHPVLGKTTQTADDGIYWQTAGSVQARWLDGYSMVAATAADSGLEGIPYYYFQVIANNADSSIFWSSNIDSGYSVDNIPPVPISGAAIGTGQGADIVLKWNTDRVDPDLMGYRVYRAASPGFSLDASTLLAIVKDTAYTDAATSLDQTYYYRVAGVDVHGNVGTPSGQLSETALAITLSSFNVTASRLSVELAWTTTTEINSAGYEIQRSLASDPQSAWQDVGFVAGAGNSNSPINYSYSDMNLTATNYNYRLKQIDRSGNFYYSQSIEVEVGVAADVFELSQNFPNPFNPSTNIQFTVPTDGRATLKVFNTLGQEVATLFNDNASAGIYHQVQFNAANLASGIYFSQLEFAGKVQIKKMLLLK